MIKAEEVHYMGNDLTVVNAARVSFDKQSKWEVIHFDNYDEMYNFCQKKLGAFEDPHMYSDTWYGGHTAFCLSDKDEKLINYLASHSHWTPFSHPQVTMKITAPIFLARQLFKHKVGFSENEISRRYVDSNPEFYTPKVWRKRVDNKKQGSSVDPVHEPLQQRMYGYTTTENAYNKFIEYARDFYQDLLDNGTCPEQARMVLPQSMITEWYWTGSLAAWARVYKLRSDPESAQREHLELMRDINLIMSNRFPVSWFALTGSKYIREYISSEADGVVDKEEPEEKKPETNDAHSYINEYNAFIKRAVKLEKEINGGKTAEDIVREVYLKDVKYSMDESMAKLKEKLYHENMLREQELQQGKENE